MGEEEERLPAPRQAEIKRLEGVRCLPRPGADISPGKQECPCKPERTWGSTWLSAPESIPGSTLPAVSTPRGLAVVGVTRRGLEAFLLAARDVQTHWIPDGQDTACPRAAPSWGAPFIVPPLSQLLPASGLEQT